MTIIDKLREINAKPHLGPTELTEIGSALPELLRVAEAAKHAREVQSWGQVPRQVHEGEANQELDDALAALEVG